MSLLFYPAILILFFVVFITVEAILGVRRILLLDEVDVVADPDPPLVSILIPALNEEDKIEAALASVLALDYPRLEIIALNDRSTDATPEILDRMAAQYSQLRVIHIQDLPAGWLGKNHALHLGAKQANGDFLLFTDADVLMAPDTIDRAVTRMQEQQLDHLCLIFRPTRSSALLGMLVADSLAGLLSLLKPWKAADPDSCYFMGVGAFNLIKSDAYRRFGGHRPIRLCPVDDILLGRLVKENHGRQECLNGRNFLTVPWYSSVKEMITGLRKNSYAVLDYRFDRLVLVTILTICCNIIPFWTLLFSNDTVLRLVCFCILATTGVAQFIATRTLGVGIGCLRWYLFTPYLKMYILWQAVIITLIQGGINWRGTFYSLDELKRNAAPLWPWQKMNDKK